MGIEKEEEMRQFSWTGNNGCAFPDPGSVSQVKCGICGAQMQVERNVYGPASFNEVMTGYRHLHDLFTCPYLVEKWHKKIVELKMETYARKIRVEDENEVRRNLEEQIRKILEVA